MLHERGDAADISDDEVAQLSGTFPVARSPAGDCAAYASGR